MDATHSNWRDDLGDISDSGLILLNAKLALAAIRRETIPAYSSDHAVQHPKMVTNPMLWQPPSLGE